MNSEIDSVFTCVAYSYPIQRSLHIVDGKLVWFIPNTKCTFPRFRTDLSRCRSVLFLSHCSLCGEPDFWGENTAGLVLSELEVQDLDTQTDWALAEMKYELLHK